MRGKSFSVEHLARSPEGPLRASAAPGLAGAVVFLAGAAAAVGACLPVPSAVATPPRAAAAAPAASAPGGVQQQLDRILVENARQRLERLFDGGGPPSPRGDGGGGGGGSKGFAFVNAEVFCSHLVEFLNETEVLTRALKNSALPWNTNSDNPEAWRFGVIGYEGRLRTLLHDVQAKGASAQRCFVVCRVDEVSSYLFMLEREPTKRKQKPLLPALRLRDALWRVDDARRQIYPVPTRVDVCKIELRAWLERQSYELLED